MGKRRRWKLGWKRAIRASRSTVSLFLLLRAACPPFGRGGRSGASHIHILRPSEGATSLPSAITGIDDILLTVSRPKSPSPILPEMVLASESPFASRVPFRALDAGRWTHDSSAFPHPRKRHVQHRFEMSDDIPSLQFLPSAGSGIM